jgi:soluble lytic murein transglycosylase-like protein
MHTWQAWEEELDFEVEIEDEFLPDEAADLPIEDEYADAYDEPDPADFFSQADPAYDDPFIFEIELRPPDVGLIVRAVLAMAALTGALLWCLATRLELPPELAAASAAAAPVQVDPAAGPAEARPGALASSGEAPKAGQDCAVSGPFPPAVRQWCGLITYYAGQRGLHPDLVAALIWQESGGKSLAYSKNGAVGLMQIMPRDGISATFTCANGPCFADRPSTSELQDPEFNIKYGTRMLAGLVSRHGNLRDALKSYAR